MTKISAKQPAAALIWAILALTALPGLARDAIRGEQPAPPPEPNPLDIEVPRGGPVWITLSAYSITSPIIRYRIRRQPEGKLGSPQIVTASTAVVKYTPPAGAGPGEDSFVFQVQSVDGVSAPAEVYIRITDKDPLLVAPNDIDFGEVLPGETARRQLVLQNIGGGLAQGTVSVPEGWMVEGDAAYRLGAGAQQSFTLVFKPLEERDYTGDAEYTGEPGRATDLNGKEVAPIAVTPGPVELRQVGTMRVGMIQVQNRTDGERTVHVTAGPHLAANESVEAPAKGMAEIVVRAKPGEEGEIHDHVTVTVDAEGLKADIPVEAVAVLGQGQTPAASLPAETPVSAGAVGPIGPTGPITAAAAPEELPEMTLPPLASDLGTPAEQEARTPVSPLEVESLGKDEARVTCNFNSAAPVHSYRLEAQTLVLDAHGRAEAKWVPVAHATVEVNGPAVSADLKHLQPNALYLVRLLGLDQEGRIVAISSAGEVWTARAAPGGHWGWVALIGALLAGAAAWRWRTLPTWSR